MSNPAIRPQPNGDVDISLPDKDAQAIADGEGDVQPEPSVDPANLDHPEELMGE
jgi:hypothetical protein